ncbi:ATP-binding cassette domain-containing protein [Williamsia sp.]|uniref:ATP-binding cassette domain-containing protein n=1 Tax=Williamsia sp. TaxID=1872085 RepID=UPI002F935A14
MNAGAYIRDLKVEIATRGGRRAPGVTGLAGVDLTMARGELTALMGESGCGKSLVAVALCGLLPPGSTVSGEVLINGESIAATDDKRWRRIRGREVGLIPQSPATSFTPVRTVGSQITECIRILGGARTARELAEVVELPVSALDLFPHELSGGMAQRAAIAAALAGDPSVLVADEPTSALDPALAAATWRLLRSMADGGAGVLVITHDVSGLFAEDICDSVALMRAGRIVATGTPTSILDIDNTYVSTFFDGVSA